MRSYLSIKLMKVFFYDLIIHSNSIIISLEYTKSLNTFKILSIKVIRPLYFSNKLERELVSTSRVIY